jgi:hypothetical protein
MLRPSQLEESRMRLIRPVVTLVAFALAPATARAQFANVDACSLLIPSEASKAIEVKVEAGVHLVEGSKGECVWTDGAVSDVGRRRVTLSIMAPAAFNRMKSSPALKTEPASGVGDEAFYVIPKGGGPILAVRKGGVFFQIKILNGFKAKPIGAAEVQARELALGAAAAGRA